MVISIREATHYKKVDARYHAILDILWAAPDHRIVSRSGQATDIIYRQLPMAVLADRHGEKPLRLHTLSGYLQKMEQYGWIIREIKGKRLMSVMIVDTPADWQPSLFPTTTVEPTTVADLHEYEVDEEAKDGGIRPGRLAARLEHIEESIPAMVEEGVVHGIRGMIVQLAVSLGASFPKPENDETDEVNTLLFNALKELNGVKEELIYERAMGEYTREELNKVMRYQVSTRDTTQLKVSEVMESWRSLAVHAVNSGWTLHRTRGGHIMWKAPDGARYFSSSTSSDWRSVRNARSDMEKLGLPKEDK